ncbi:hypothetical protein IU433_18665 [Nocardia puris]|uniref:hypothetical protein n=1 Tax=Nocardia puris TaxID=208602 RepID=UPI000DE9B01E|nr:hypothetical protein [Nocardia puris]MBF6212469.1 hypothetical protein [Nocardia puris]MBF6366716.1 hypothetical protein [Nocardia puris]MBF6461058.1 hypothetical protein [Nocardia puris]
MDVRYEALADAAFGGRPGMSAAELPAAHDAYGHWLRAVVLGGQGRYAAARAELARVRAGGADPVLLSLAASTRGSLLRQLGWHTLASGPDGDAAGLALPLIASRAASGSDEGPLPGLGRPYRPDAYDAAADALTGLAADALGVGRIALARRLLARCAATVPDDRWRAGIRRHWVSAEAELAAGAAEAALPHARAAVAAADDASSVRHRIKSRLLLAAASAAAGDLGTAKVMADIVAADCRERDLLPLRWACAMLRSGLGEASAEREARACSAEIARRGGTFRPLGL